MSEAIRARLMTALKSDDMVAIEALLHEDPSQLNTPKEPPAILAARSVATAGQLISLGADVEAAGNWWAAGFHTRQIDSEVARFLIERGAPLSVHAAAGLGLTDRLRGMLRADPSLVDAKGGDGCTPLHFARDVATAQLLLEHGARVDARDDDHDSTPAQWLIGDAPEVARFLLENGATPDIFLAAALGDRPLAERVIAQNRGCLAQRIGKAPEIPSLGYRGRGGSIYQWTLGFNSYSHQIALKKGHEPLFGFFYEQSDTTTRFLVSCLLARREEAEAIAAAHPTLVSSLSKDDLELLPRYCWETNENYDAVKLMLDVGFPIAHPEHTHGFTALHNAAWSGSADLVELLLSRGHPVDLIDPRFHASALDFAIYDCTVEKRHPDGDFSRVTQLLADAGCPWDALHFPFGDKRIDEVLEPHMHQRVDGAALLGDEAALDRLLGQNPSGEAFSAALAGAAKGANTALCARLVEAGADVNGSCGSRCLTPLMWAVSARSLETVALLLEKGAHVRTKNATESTALHMALVRGAGAKIIELLLQSGAGADIEAANTFGQTPLRLAQDTGREDLVELLARYR